MAGGAERAVSSSSERRRATHNEVNDKIILYDFSILFQQEDIDQTCIQFIAN